MADLLSDPQTLYVVVVNRQGQHSIWPVALNIPRGWEAVGSPADKLACLQSIEKNWTDMRPRSLGVSLAQKQKAGC